MHTGEVEVVGGDVRGAAVHEAARISAAADGGEIFVSATTRQLVVGSGLTFEDRGEREFKGLTGARTIYAFRTDEPAGAGSDERPAGQPVADLVRGAAAQTRGAARRASAATVPPSTAPSCVQPPR